MTPSDFIGLINSGSVLSLVVGLVMYMGYRAFNIWEKGQLEKRSNTDYLPKNFIYKYITNYVFRASKEKNGNMKAIILNNHIMGNEEKTMQKIVNMLEAKTSEYIGHFNKLNCDIPNLGDFYSKAFPWDDFIKEIEAIVTKKLDGKLSPEVIVLIKGDDIWMVMEKYQNIANKALDIEISKL